jgi:anti-sigma factor (TIGR02949 family)
MNRIDDDTLPCDEALDLLEPYVDGDLPPATADRLRVHLETCRSCAAELALAQRIQRELRALPQLDCPPEILERVRNQGGEVVPFRPRRTGFPLRVAAAAAVLALALGGGALFIRSQQPRQPSAAEIAQATAEARYALAYISKVSRRTGLDLRDDVLSRRLVRPAARSLSLPLGIASGEAQEPAPDRGEQP